MKTGRKFVILTGGRCGSTAVAAELANHPDIICYGELFFPPPVRQSNFREMYDKFGIDFFSPDETQFIPYLVYAEDHLSLVGCPEADYRRRYVQYFGARAGGFRPGAAVGFKVLYRHAGRQTGLLDILKEEGFAFLHLIRRNVVRQTISGMIARERGIHNRKNWEMPRERYRLDIDKFDRKLRSNRQKVRKNRKLLRELNVDCLEIFYESYVQDREAFFAPLFSFLGVENKPVPGSDWSVMTDRDLPRIIENYDELRRATKALDLEDLLETA